MTTLSWGRSKRVAAAASVLAVIAVTVAVLVLALGASLPETWWPSAGQAFAADTARTPAAACGRIVGPAKAYCERGHMNSASAEHHRAATAVWRLVPAGAGLAALVMWRRRSAAGQRQH